jgi:hypothetical protein
MSMQREASCVDWLTLIIDGLVGGVDGSRQRGTLLTSAFAPLPVSEVTVSFVPVGNSPARSSGAEI